MGVQVVAAGGDVVGLCAVHRIGGAGLPPAIEGVSRLEEAELVVPALHTGHPRRIVQRVEGDVRRHTASIPGEARRGGAVHIGVEGELVVDGGPTRIHHLVVTVIFEKITAFDFGFGIGCGSLLRCGIPAHEVVTRAGHAEGLPPFHIVILRRVVSRIIYDVRLLGCGAAAVKLPAVRVEGQRMLLRGPLGIDLHTAGTCV